jgi:allantoate deiminase
MKQLNFGKGLHSEPYRTDIASFIELHIEQGKQLEMSRCDIGIVSSIVGQKRFTVSVKGESNHAGTTPMNIRKDAFYVSCKLAKAFIELSEKYHNALYVTVGKITLSPNAPNVIPGYVEFTVDIRHHEYEVLQEAEREMKEIIKRTAGDLEVNIDCWMDEKPVAMSEELSELSKIISSEKNISSRELVSGAGHDSQVFGRRVPTCLLFVPSQDGISHSPKEFTKGEQLEKGVKVLIELLYKLAY